MKDYIFFTCHDFLQEGGATIRMYGILNALAAKGHSVTLISNTKDFSKFHNDIKHIYLDYKPLPSEKRKLQFILGVFGAGLARRSFEKLFSKCHEKLSPFCNKDIYFFEYLDNSIGYWMKKMGSINSYINDLHGVATLEFDFQLRHNTSLSRKITLYLKKRVALLLDRKVLCEATKNIFASQSMRQYYTKLYPCLKDKPYFILSYLLPDNISERHVDSNLMNQIIQKYGFTNDHKIILFAGAFKLTGGVHELISAFNKIHNRYPHARLLLVGDGFEFENCKKSVYDFNLEHKVFFTGRTPYDHLATYQELSDILVCPDTDNGFSNLIIHVKYLDALLANKIVIQGSFDSVVEINENERLSVGFKPSDIDALSDALSRSIEEYENLKLRYADNKEYALSHLTYANNVNGI